MGIKKVIHFDISEQVYDSDCHVFIGWRKGALEAMNQHLKKHYPLEILFIESDIADCCGVAFQFDKQRVSYLWLPRVPKTPSEHGTLAHEFCHIILHYFNQIGFPLDYTHDEPVCYFMKFMVKSFWEKINGG